MLKMKYLFSSMKKFDSLQPMMMAAAAAAAVVVVVASRRRLDEAESQIKPDQSGSSLGVDPVDDRDRLCVDQLRAEMRFGSL